MNKEKTNELLEKLNENDIGSTINFEGNEEFNPFMGIVDSFELDTDGSIYANITDQEDCTFAVALNEIEEYKNLSV